jgi:hypothetical protein
MDIQFHAYKVQRKYSTEEIENYVRTVDDEDFVNATLILTTVLHIRSFSYKSNSQYDNYIT